MPTKIKDNESIQPLINLLELGKISFSVLDKIPFIYKLSPKIKSFKEQFIEVQNQSSIRTLPDQFNELFSKEGWICYGALNQSILEESVKLGLDDKIDEAKLLLIDSINENSIDLVLRKCRTREHFKLRVELLKLLKIDYLEERYHACIPLLLALIDGLANDISKPLGFFAENCNLELYDSITSHETGLPFLQIIMNQSRTKTTTEIIHIPYRNGILHGRDLNFANKEVASKCWWVLNCLIDWADEKQLNKQPKEPVSFISVLKQHQNTQELLKRIDLWKPRPIQLKDYWMNQTLETVGNDSPEFTLLDFLNHWKNKHWGKLSPLLIDNIGKHLGKATKEIKSDYQKIELLNFKIIALEDYTPSSTRILTNIQYIKDEQHKEIEINITLNYAHSTTGSPELKGEPGGQWYIRQLSLNDLLFN